jgi:hypothetical protein
MKIFICSACSLFLRYMSIYGKSLNITGLFYMLYSTSIRSDKCMSKALNKNLKQRIMVVQNVLLYLYMTTRTCESTCNQNKRIENRGSLAILY